MKWGVRRYQNYDGSYTQKGLARYRKAQEDYDNAKDAVKRTKKAYKSGTATKSQYKTAKGQAKIKKSALNKTYNDLKKDNLADQGKELHKRGKNETDLKKEYVPTQIGIAVGTFAVSSILKSKIADQKIGTIADSLIMGGGLAVNAILAGKRISDQTKLSAYYER